MPAGVSATGLTIKTLEELQDEIIAEEQALISPALDTSPDQILGQLNGVIAGKLAELWEGLQVAYNAFNPDAAEGYLLDTIGALRGSPRLDATVGSVVLNVNLDAGTTLTAGVATANVAGQSANRWTIAQTYTAAVAGTFARTFVATEPGRITASASTITEITTPVAGWNSVTNPALAIPGKEAETDSEYRLRQATLLASPGASTVDAIRADMLRLENMKQATVYENTTDAIDPQGRPPHSFEVVFRDDNLIANTLIAQTIWDAKPAGIATYGSGSGTATDSLGNARTMNFSRATAVTLDFTLSITTLPGWNVSQMTNIENRITEYFATLRVGEDVLANRIRTLIMMEPYVWDAPTVLIWGGFSQWTIDYRQYAVLGVLTTTYTALPAVP